MLCGTRSRGLTPVPVRPSFAAAPPNKTRTPAVLHLLGRQVTSGARDTDRDRERLGERTSSERGEGGDWREEEARFVQSRRELVTAVGDNRQETHHADIYTAVFKNKRTAFSYPALLLPILLPCAPTLLLSSINLGALPLFLTPLHRPYTLISTHTHTHTN